MQLVLLAAGRGSRLGVAVTNKCFLKIHNKCLLDYNLEMFLTLGISEIIIIVGYNSNYIKDYIGSAYHNIPVIYVTQEQLLGIAHAIKIASDYIHDSFIMCLSDELYINPKIIEMNQTFKSNSPDCLCGAVVDTEENIQKAYTMKLTANGTILQLREKPQIPFNQWKGTGCCFMQKTMLPLLTQLQPNAIRKEYEMADWIQLAIDNGLICKMYPIAERNFNINTINDLTMAESYCTQQEENCK